MARTVSLRVFGKSPTIVSHEIKRQLLELRNINNSLSKTAKNKMRARIKLKQHRRGNTGKLARSIKSHYENLGAYEIWGIGKISELPDYWYVANYGTGFKTRKKYIPPVTKGSFYGNPPDSSLTGVGKQKFSKDGKFIMIPKTPVRPLHYIGPVQGWLRIAWNKAIDGIIAR